MNNYSTRPTGQKYGDYSTDMQLTCLQDRESFLSNINTPNLSESPQADVCQWMYRHLVSMLSLSDTSEMSDLFTELVKVLYIKFMNTKPQAFVLFCGMCKVGEYKVSYGKVKPYAIIEAADKFLTSYLPPIMHGIKAKMSGKKKDDEPAWQFIEHKALWYAMRDDLFRIYESDGERRIVRLHGNMGANEWHELHCLAGMGALVMLGERIQFNNELFDSYVSQLKEYTDGKSYKPTRQSYYSINLS